MNRAGHDMRHITIKLMREDLPRASLVLAELEAFAPDERPLLASRMSCEHVSTSRTWIIGKW